MEHAESATRTTPGDVRSGKVVTAAARGERDVLARRIDMERSAVRHALGRDERPSGPSFLYDEWDMHAAGYRRGWCRLYECAVDTGRGADVRGLAERIAPHRASVQRRFAEIRPRGYARVRRVLDGEELDLDELIDYITESRRGNDVDERVYRRRDRLVRDVAVAFLLDLSASTDDPVVKPTPVYVSDADTRHVNLRDPFDNDDDPEPRLDDGPPPRRIIDVLREALLLMATALEHHRDHWGLYGFSGYGRDNVEYYVVKELGARFSYTTLEALAALKPRRSTRMGPAIRHSTWKLRRTASPLKVLIVVSDGFPQDCDYGPDRSDHEYGVEDTARALEEAQRAGIETFCVTVDRAGHDYLKRMCPGDRYLVIDELDALPLELTKVYQKLTAR
jgi:nitric oxide reductase activation protein